MIRFVLCLLITKMLIKFINQGINHLCRPEFVKSGSFVVDVGISRVEVGLGESKIFGDVDPAVADVAGFVTPVPSGVGPCTVACLLKNTIQAAMWTTFK